ncbi:MAG: hypothetical protein HY290_32485 [Planctomycetia bacterium]|nr:hypothetical protein [Planctomycetia bacterium]
MQPIYWIVIAVAVVVYIGLRVFLDADARVFSLQKWADLNNFTFQREKDASIGPRYAQLTRLSSHQNCSASNVVRGSLGEYTFCAFDFIDLDQRRRSNVRHKHGPTATSFAAVVIETDLGLPPVVIERETLLEKVAKTFGAEDVQFESDAFNAKFMVRSPDKSRAIAIVGPAIQQLLVDTPLFEFESSLQVLELHGSLVLARSRSDQFFSEKDYPELLQLLADLLALMAASMSDA